MKDSSARLENSIRTLLSPHLRSDGFSGSGRTFRRVVGTWIQIVNIQGSRYGGQFAINLGLHPMQIPDVLGDEVDPKKITESACEFRRRLSESGVHQWWNHDSSQSSMDEAAAAAAQVYVRIGRPLLDLMSGPHSPFNRVSVEDLERDRFDHLHGFGRTAVRTAFALAQMRRAEGRITESRAFATYGLKHVGPATALRTKFEWLLNVDGAL